MQCYDLTVSKGRDFTYNFGPWCYKEIKRIVFTIYSTGKPFIELRQQQQSETALDWVELQLYTVMLLAHPSQPNSLYKLFLPTQGADLGFVACSWFCHTSDDSITQAFPIQFFFATTTHVASNQASIEPILAQLATNGLLINIFFTPSTSFSYSQDISIWIWNMYCSLLHWVLWMAYKKAWLKRKYL